MSEVGRILGVDYGSVRIGLAISDAGRSIASPLATYQRRSKDLDAHFFRDIMTKEEIGQVVLGLPVHLDGREGQKALEVRSFGKWLVEVTEANLIFWDERFSSVEAESHLWAAGLTHKKRKEKRDQVAAQIFLQAYLEAGCPVESKMMPLDD